MHRTRLREPPGNGPEITSGYIKGDIVSASALALAHGLHATAKRPDLFDVTGECANAPIKATIPNPIRVLAVSCCDLLRWKHERRSNDRFKGRHARSDVVD